MSIKSVSPKVYFLTLGSTLAAILLIVFSFFCRKPEISVSCQKIEKPEISVPIKIVRPATATEFITHFETTSSTEKLNKQFETTSSTDQTKYDNSTSVTSDH
jgi:hypothetical protein